MQAMPYTERTAARGPENVRAGSTPRAPRPPAPAQLLVLLRRFEAQDEVAGAVWKGSCQLKGRYVFGDFTYILNYPSGQDKYGPLFHTLFSIE